MTTLELKSKLLAIARNCIQNGPGYSQESVVLRDAVEQLGIYGNLKEQQRLLTAWHDLFKNGDLSWGYDVDNPGSPFFHVPESEVQA